MGLGDRRPQRPYLKGRTVSDIKLFRVGDGGLDELQGRFVAVEIARGRISGVG